MTTMRPRFAELQAGFSLATGARYKIIIPSPVVRIRLTGILFELDKSFLLPLALPAIRQVKELYDRYRPQTILVSGHADRAGSDAHNLVLSVERAQAVAAFMKDAVDDWLQWYEGKRTAKRWGPREDQYMLSVVTTPDGGPYYRAPVGGASDPATRQAVHKFQVDHGLPQGEIDTETRRQLVRRYMATDETTVPPETNLIVHGCGESHPSIATADSVALRENRRVELFLFRGPVDPAPVDPCPQGGCDEYAEWVARSTDTIDIDVGPGSSDGPHLVVYVRDFDGSPVKGATVWVLGLGTRMTDASGLVDFGEVPPGKYEVQAQRPGYRPAVGQPEGPAKAAAELLPAMSATVDLTLDGTLVRTEDIIVIGAEMYDSTFWTKMMFVAAAHYYVRNTARADVNTVVYVDRGYTADEKALIGELARWGCRIVPIYNSTDLVNRINDRPKKVVGDRREHTLVRNLVFFSHGVPGVIGLNFNESTEVDFTRTELAACKRGAFVPEGSIASYSCRTGVTSTKGHFGSDAEAGIDRSLAQEMANHFKVPVHAFLTRTDYQDVIRHKPASAAIAATLKAARSVDEGKVIPIPPEHEAYPHPDLNHWYQTGPGKEGTDEYVLWRKQGGMALPKSGASPTGLTPGLHLFLPK